MSTETVFWRYLALTGLFFLLSGCDRDPSMQAADYLAKGRELAHRYPIVDGHVDVPFRHHKKRPDLGVQIDEGEFDFPRAIAGGLDAPFMSIFTPSSLQEEGGSKENALYLIDYVNEIANRNPDKFVVAASVSEVLEAKKRGKVALLMGMENGSPVESDLQNLDIFYRKGVRYITLCHGKNNEICDSSYDTSETWEGLSPFGREVVLRMNELGIMVDVSHISDASFWDVLELSKAPVIASHSSSRRFTTGFQRNMADDMVKELADRDGVIMINFGSGFLDGDFNEAWKGSWDSIQALMEERGVDGDSADAREVQEEYFREHPINRPDVNVVADHIDHVVSLVGVEHVGFGSDFDGVGPTLPHGLEDVSMYPNLLAVLLERGYSEGDLEKICSGNIFRVMNEVERIARQP